MSLQNYYVRPPECLYPEFYNQIIRWQIQTHTFPTDLSKILDRYFIKIYNLTLYIIWSQFQLYETYNWTIATYYRLEIVERDSRSAGVVGSELGLAETRAEDFAPNVG